MSIVPGHRFEPCSGGFSSKDSDLQPSTSRYRLRHFRLHRSRTPHCGQFRVDQLLARAQFLYESTLQIADLRVCRPERDRNVDSYKIPTTGVQQLRIADSPGDPNYWSAPTKNAQVEPGRWARRGAGRSWRRSLHPRCPGRPGPRPRSRRSRRRSRLRPWRASPYRARSAQAEKPAPRKPRPPKP